MLITFFGYEDERISTFLFAARSFSEDNIVKTSAGSADVAAFFDPLITVLASDEVAVAFVEFPRTVRAEAETQFIGTLVTEADADGKRIVQLVHVTLVQMANALIEPLLIHDANLLCQSKGGLIDAALSHHKAVRGEIGFGKNSACQRNDDHCGAKPVSHVVLDNNSRPDAALLRAEAIAEIHAINIAAPKCSLINHVLFLLCIRYVNGRRKPPLGRFMFRLFVLDTPAQGSYQAAACCAASRVSSPSAVLTEPPYAVTLGREYHCRSGCHRPAGSNPAVAAQAVSLVPVREVFAPLLHRLALSRTGSEVPDK